MRQTGHAYVDCLFLVFDVLLTGGKKPGSTDHKATSKATNAANGDANASMRGESVRSLERRERRELEAKQWPKLGATEEKEVINSHSSIATHQVYIDPFLLDNSFKVIATLCHVSSRIP